MTSANSKYNLEERTAKFAEDIIKFAQKIPVNKITERLISQIVGSGTSVGANYCEAADAESKKDFIHKVGISRKESKETKYWLRMIALAETSLKEEARILWKEAQELNLILSASILTARKRKENDEEAN